MHLPSVVFKKTETMLSLTTARSSKPSRLRSTATIPCGNAATASCVDDAILTVAEPIGVALKSIETVFELTLATARSGAPSPFKSPIAIAYGNVPVPNEVGGAKLAEEALAAVTLRSTDTVFAPKVRDDEIKFSIAIDVGNADVIEITRDKISTRRGSSAHLLRLGWCS